MDDPVEKLKALEAACHRALRNPNDDGLRALLLEALAAYRAVPAASFPAEVHHLVATSHDQADTLCLRILETNAGAGRSIEHELTEVCHTLLSLAAALNGRAASSAAST